ncbi:MerR family transcriptional regulator [Ornithinibacillus sp. BX22]|uniref:MerR family transcriptional regulator n=2 Tax=Ornithinibacillus TaxID=484508 RepID=A0A923L6H9_9BACI|nr:MULTISPECIES: MerR family transcriptional regulator [Ornithinibacillus]MBC5637344.1 MerR family transcriptional regulator [Ornithinibacillus hominis]MBS3680349.1 MerR family transcriptional regulator [Ornithinibacillus massiliensis]
MEYTVNKLARISGVSGRTLRYYDQIGLLKPARINSSGYRIYGQEEVDLLQQILFYRELDVSLEDIMEIIQQPDFNRKEALKNHHAKLKQKRARLDQIMATVEKTIASMEGGVPMQDNEKFAGLKEKLIEENEKKYGKEIREKYGNDIVEASNTKLRGMTQADYQAMTELGEEIMNLLKEAYKTGDPASEKAQQLAEKHKQWLLYSWTNYSKEAHAGLAEMYVADERFTAYYDTAIKGGTKFLRDAIMIYLDS